MEIAQDPYSMALLGLIYAKKRRRKSHAWAPLSDRLLLVAQELADDSNPPVAFSSLGSTGREKQFYR